MKTKFAWLAVIVLFMIAASLLMQPTQVNAQATATFTATSAPTNTPTATATPIATAYPIAQSLTGFVQGVKVGTYGLTWSTTGDGLQINGGQGLSINNAVGRQVFHVNGVTGDVTVYGGISTTGNFTPTGNLSATSIDVGGGYGSAGCTITANGVLSCNDAMKTDSGFTTGDATGSAGSVAVTNGTVNTIVLTGSSGAISASTLTASTSISSTAIKIGADQFSGAIRYGAAATYTSGTDIAHGLSVTPTVCGPLGWSSAITDAVVSMGNATQFSVTFSAGTTPTLYWMCGK